MNGVPLPKQNIKPTFINKIKSNLILECVALIVYVTKVVRGNFLIPLRDGPVGSFNKMYVIYSKMCVIWIYDIRRTPNNTYQLQMTLILSKTPQGTKVTQDNYMLASYTIILDY